MINNQGKVIGVVVRLPFDSQSTSDHPRYDLMGYGVCLPSKYIEQLMLNPEVVPLKAEAKYYKTVYVKNMEIKEYTKPFTHEAGTEIIAVIKNNSIETRTVEMKVTAIDKNSGETVTNGDTVFAVAPGETTIATTWFEHQVDSFEASYTCSKTEELSIIKDLEVEATQNPCNLILAVTNKSNYIGRLSVYGLFMDENGKVIGLDMEDLCDADVMSLLPGETRYVELDCSRYDNVVYDNVEYYFQGFASRPDAETAKSVADISDFDFGEYLIKSKYGGYNYILTTKNNSGKEVVIKGTAIAYDEEGTPIGVVDNTLQAIAPGEESALEFTFFDLTDISKVEYKLDFGKPLYTMSLCSQISAEEIVKDDDIADAVLPFKDDEEAGDDIFDQTLRAEAQHQPDDPDARQNGGHIHAQYAQAPHDGDDHRQVFEHAAQQVGDGGGPVVTAAYGPEDQRDHRIAEPHHTQSQRQRKKMGQSEPGAPVDQKMVKPELLHVFGGLLAHRQPPGMGQQQDQHQRDAQRDEHADTHASRRGSAARAAGTAVPFSRGRIRHDRYPPSC